MDVNTLLKAIVEHTAEIAEFLTNGEEMSAVERTGELAQEVTDMGEWLDKGGSTPDGMTSEFITNRQDAVRRAHNILRRIDNGREPTISTARSFTRAVRKLI